VRRLREHVGQLSRFATVGLICVVLNLALFDALVDHLGWNYLAVTVLAFFAVNAVGFALGRIWIFRATHEAAAPQAARYLLIQGLSLTLNLSLMWLLVRICGANSVAASLLISVLFAIGNFLAQRNWAFRRLSCCETARMRAVEEPFPKRTPSQHPARDAGQ
jgi:putative flippase GtrA